MAFRNFWILGLFVFSIAVGAKDKDSSFAIGGSSGLPHLLAFDMRYVGFENVEFGLSFGSLPLNSLLSGQITLSPQDVDLQQSDPYRLYPRAGFSLTGYTPYLRYYPSSGVFYFQLSYSMWRFLASVNGDLRNETTGTTSAGVVSGTLSINQVVLTPSLGWRWIVAQSFHLDFGLGLSFLRRTQAAVNVGGSLGNFVGLVPSAEQAFNDAVDQIESQLDTGVAALQDNIPILPSLYLGLNFAF